MRIALPDDLDGLATYIRPMLDLVGEERWFRRAEHFATEVGKSRYRWKIVSDYHWLEMGIAFQAEVLEKEGRLNPNHADTLIMAALNFAGSCVEIHRQLSPAGRLALEGRLRDAIKSDVGFAPLYLELDLAQRLMGAGYEVTFPDLEGQARYDLVFANGVFSGEVECKSLSADAGRQIHRRDFYRVMAALEPALDARLDSASREILLVTLDARLSPNDASRMALLKSVHAVLADGGPATLKRPGFMIERLDYEVHLGDAPISDPKRFHAACQAAFGGNTHAAGSMSDDGGVVVVMRSRREDDASKPMLEAMRQAARQFSGERPAFIALQEHGIEAADLMLPHLRRQAGLLAYYLYEHYGAAHVNGVYVTGFGAVVMRDGRIGTPAFTVPNPSPRFDVTPVDAAPFLASISDQAYAEAIGSPLPAADISNLRIVSL